MSEPSSASKCPTCGAAMPDHAPQGLCPKCLLLGVAAPTETNSTEDCHRSPPPSIAAVAAAFPQLEILELVGQGGMGCVFKARQPQLNRLVALKLLPESMSRDNTFATRFTREAQTLAALSHPNIVTIHDFGQSGGFFYLLMEYVDGVNLRQALRGGHFTPEQALAIVPPLCDALQFAHERGVVHRDIKPENLLLDKAGRIKVADFGIAKMLASTEQPVSAAGIESEGVPGSREKVAGFGLAKIIEPGRAELPLGPENGAAQQHSPTGVMGTPRYMAPEQRERPHQADHRADIYSLGVVFYEMLTGELPAEALQPPSRKVHIDVRLDEIVLRALEREPELRYQTASQVKEDIETVVNGPLPLKATLNGEEVKARLLHAEAARQIQVPAVGMIITGVLNLLGLMACCVYLGVAAFQSQNRHAGEVLYFLNEAELKRTHLEEQRRNTESILKEEKTPETEALRTRAERELKQATEQFEETKLKLAEAKQFSLRKKWGIALLYGVPVWAVLGMIASGFAIFGGFRLMRLRNRSIGKTAAILSMLTPPAFPLGITFGIWSWLVLARPEVRHAFEVSPEPVPPSPERPPLRPSLSSAVMVGLAAGLLALSGSVLITSLLPDEYAGSVRIRFREPDSMDQSARIQWFPNPVFLQTEFEVLRSQRVLGDVVERLKLNERWGTRYGRGSPLSTHECLLLLNRQLDVRPIRKSALCDVRFFSRDPNEAAEIANAIAMSYAKYYLVFRGPNRVEIVDSAQPSKRPSRPNKPARFMIGALLSLIIGLMASGIMLAVAYSGRWKNGNKTDLPKPVTSHLGFARFALGMFIAGTFGALLLITGIYRHGLAVIFSALTLILALVFGVLAWRQRMGRIIAITVLLILVAVGITVGIIVAVFTIGEAMQS